MSQRAKSVSAARRPHSITSSVAANIMPLGPMGQNAIAA